MVTGILGKKIGMTQLFSADGVVTPATVIKAGPCVVVQRKTVERDGYDAVQLGLVEDTPPKVNKPTAGHYKKANVPPTRIRREVGIAPFVIIRGLWKDYCVQRCRTKRRYSKPR